MTKCPYCGRTLREHERYCDFCEQDLTKVVEGQLKPKNKKKIQEKAKPKLTLHKAQIQPKKETTFKAYCVKCRKKVNGKNPTDYTMKNNRQAIKGICPFCSTKVFRIVGMNKKLSKSKKKR